MRGFSTSRSNEIDDCLVLLRIETSNKDTECCTRLGVGTAGAVQGDEAHSLVLMTILGVSRVRTVGALENK